MLYPAGLYWSLCSIGVTSNEVLPIVPVWISPLWLFFRLDLFFCLGHCECLLNSITEGTVMICPQSFLMSLREWPIDDNSSFITLLSDSLQLFISYGQIAKFSWSSQVREESASASPLLPPLVLDPLNKSSQQSLHLTKGPMLGGVSNFSLLQHSGHLQCSQLRTMQWHYKTKLIVF